MKKICLCICVILLIPFMFSCQNVAYLEIKNSTGRDLTMRIKHSYGEKYYNETMDISNGATETKEIKMKGANNEWTVSVMEYVLYEYGKDKNTIGGGFFSKDETNKHEIVSLLKAVPDIRLVGKWQYTLNSDRTITFENSNKCKMIPSKPYVTLHGDYDFEEWKVQDDKIYFRKWLDISTKDGLERREHLWDAYIYTVVSSTEIMITGLDSTTGGDSYIKVSE